MKNRGFTIAEVLIVMALIGFLFTLMIPHLVQKQVSQKNIESLKTAQSKLQEAFDITAKANNNLNPQDWESVRNSENKSEAIIKEVAKKLSVMSYCGTSPKGCFASGEYRTLNGVPTKVLNDPMEPFRLTLDPEDYIVTQTQEVTDEFGDTVEQKVPLTYTKAEPEVASTFITLLDGGSVVLKTASTYCNGRIPSTDPLERPFCGVIYVDVNGPAIPNMLGVDVFGFYLSGNTLLPMGFYGDDFNFEHNCLMEKPNADKYNGLACTAWALKNKNMEYRKCQAGSRLGWALSTRCDSPPPKR